MLEPVSLPPPPPPPKTEQKKPHRTDLCTFPFFPQTSFLSASVVPHPRQAQVYFRQVFALFPIKSLSSALAATRAEAMRRPAAWERPLPASGPASRPGCGFDPRLPERGRVSDTLSGVPEENDHCNRAPENPSSDRAERSATLERGCGDPSRRSLQGKGSWGLGPSQRPAAPDDTAFPPQPTLPASLPSIPSKAPARRLAASAKLPPERTRISRPQAALSVHGPDLSRTVDPAGWRAGSVTAEHRCCPEFPPAARKDCQSPPGGKS